MDVSQLEGTVLTHYRIEERIGQGGMGIVYRAFDTILRRPVALKILSSDILRDPGHRHRFEQEARAASSISHGNVAHVYEVGDCGGESFIVMEYVEGQTLARLMNARALELREILRIALQIADALDVAHAKGVTHRDIKPGNIMITARGEVKVLDFGLARMSTAPVMEDATAAISRTIPGTILGTAPYMSPEQALGHRVDHRSDIFSVGAVLYEMVTRKPAFGGSTFMETLMEVVNEEPKAIEAIAPSTPPELISIIKRCLNKDKQDRYNTTTELLEDLRDIQGLQQSTHRHSVPATFYERNPTPVPTRRTRTPSRRLIFSVAVLAISAVVAALAWWTIFSSRRYDSVAVMPFQNQSNDPEFEYLADGITESVIQGVSKLRKVRVVSRSSTFSFKGKQFDIEDVARKLNVDAILTGTLTVKDGMMRVSAELTDVASRGHVWGQQYTRPMAGAFVVQEDIAQEIATRLRSDLTGEEHEQVRKRYTDSSEAYRLYLKGRYHWNKRTTEGLKASIDFFQQAIDQDPTYALAYAGMADAYMLMSNVMPPGEAFGRAKAAAQKALAIDNKFAEPYTTLGYVSLHYDWNWKEAETNLKKAADLNPSYPTARSLYARYLSVMGKFPESVREMQKAQQLDPLALGIATGIGLCYYYGRQYDDAISAFNKALELNPKFQLALLDRGDAYAQKRQFNEAFESFDQAIALSPKDAGAIAQRGRAYAAAGRRQDALTALAQLEEIAGQRYVSPYFFALVYSGLRDVNGTLTYLERGVNERTSPMVFANVDPAWDLVRKAPRFRALLSRMNF